jgi:Zn-dependent protease with chaperone function
MLVQVFNHFRLTWRLAFDERVSIWLKLLLIALPLGYAVFPFLIPGVPDDFLCVIGMLDDLLLMVVATVLFNTLCPRTVVHEHRLALEGQRPAGGPHELETYRSPSETRDLAIGFLVGLGLLIVGGYLGGVMLVALFAIGYLLTSLQQSSTLANAVQVTDRQFPHLYRLLERALAPLPPVEVRLFVTQDPTMNAYTFGYHQPFTIVLHSGLVEKLNASEIQAVIGHELGHIVFGHTSVMSLLQAQRGLGSLLFFKWNRSCEYSADAVALLSSGGDLAPVISALLKLASGLAGAVDVQAFLGQLEQGSRDGVTSELAQLGSTHPLMRNRIQNLTRLARQIALP